MDLRRYAIQQAEQAGLPSELVLAQINQESGWKQGAVSPRGAVGLMQLMPETAKELGVDPADPYQNIQGGVRYLKQQMDAFGTPELALAAYNAGPGNVRKHGGIPPFQETQKYVRNITQRAGMAGNDEWTELAKQFAQPGTGPAPQADDEWAALAKEFAQPAVQPAKSQAASSKPIAINPTADMTGTQKFLAGAGKMFVDTARGGKQLAAQLGGAISDAIGVPVERTLPAIQAEIDESRRLDAPLMNTGAGVAGNIAGGLALATLPAGALGTAANTYKGAATLGALQGAVMPTATGDSRLANVALGGAAGAAGQGIANTVGRVFRPVQSALTPEQRRLAQVAAQNNIPLNAAQLTGSRPLQVIDSVMDNLPLTAGPRAAAQQTQQAAFNKAVGGTFGMPSESLTPDVMSAARDNLGKKFTDLAARNSVSQQATAKLSGDLAAVQGEVARYGVADTQRIVTNVIEDVMAKVDPSNGIMTGRAYRELDSRLGKISSSAASGDVRNYVGQVRGALRDAMDNSISPADQKSWKAIRQQYANLMTVAPLAAKDASGNVSGKTLLGAVNRGNRGAKFSGGGVLGDLGRVGREFVADSVPNSGTAQRDLYQRILMSPGALAMGGATAGYAGSGGDLSSAAVGAGLGLGMPRLAQMALNSQVMQQYLTQGLFGSAGDSITKGAQLTLPRIAQPATTGLLGY